MSAPIPTTLQEPKTPPAAAQTDQSCEESKGSNSSARVAGRKVKSRASHASGSAGEGTTTRVVKRGLPEASVEQPLKRPTIVPLTPTDSEVAWTKVVLHPFVKFGLQLAIKPNLEAYVKPKVDEASWKTIESLNFSTSSTLGDLEKLFLNVIHEAEKNSQERRVAFHAKVKASLQIYADGKQAEALDQLRKLIIEG